MYIVCEIPSCFFLFFIGFYNPTNTKKKCDRMFHKLCHTCVTSKYVILNTNITVEAHLKDNQITFSILDTCSSLRNLNDFLFRNL